MVLASSYDQSRFLKAADLNGSEKKVRIKGVSEEKMADGEVKLVVWFTSITQGLVLNKTNNRTLREAFGDETDGWAGKIVVLFSNMTDMRGRMTQGLRVRPLQPRYQRRQRRRQLCQVPLVRGRSALRAHHTLLKVRRARIQVRLSAKSSLPWDFIVELVGETRLGSRFRRRLGVEVVKHVVEIGVHRWLGSRLGGRLGCRLYRPCSHAAVALRRRDAAEAAEASLQEEFGLPLGLIIIDTIAASAGYPSLLVLRGLYRQPQPDHSLVPIWCGLPGGRLVGSLLWQKGNRNRN